MVVVSFSSRRRHTRCSRDWSSDVCSSDLASRSHRATFARFGADVALCDRDAENMATAAVEVEEAGRSALTAELDVRDADQVEAFAAAVGDRFGHVDVLVNNAGGGFRGDFLSVNTKGQNAPVRQNFE